MAYSMIQPPFTLKFEEMTKKELREYFSWFIDAIPKRIDELVEEIKNYPGFEIWQPDYTPDSLLMLGDWFALQVETRSRTQAELEEIQKNSRFPIEIPRVELTNRTFSIAVDVGMYLSQVFLKNHPSLKWGQPLGSKKFIDYAQVVLDGFKVTPFNPSRMMITLAYGLARKSKSGKDLRNIYDIWSNMIVA